MREQFILSLIPFIIYLAIKTKKGMHMLQLNWYDEDHRFLKWIVTNPYKVFLGMDMFFVIFIAFLFMNEIFAMILFVLFYLLISALTIRSNRNESTKLKFNFTARVRRISVTVLLLYLLPISVICLMFDLSSLAYYYFILGAFAYFNYFFILFANIINIPVEKQVFNHYKRLASKKLKHMNHLNVIGITGSYGKTSSKNILNDILNIKFNSFPTPKNFNTTYGLILTINNYLDKFTDTFIAEMGAFKQGEIKELCDLVHPKYGILTRIGEAHLESFGSLENTTKTKFELIESLPSDGCGVLNYDDERQRNYKLKNDCNILTIGIDFKDVDYRASNIKLSRTGSTFTVTKKGEKKEFVFETRLLGKHNIYNILAGIALGNYLGIEMEQLMIAVKGINSIPHRLELRKMGQINIIDDAYNSNPSGCKSALEVLKLMPGKRIIVTPGMIELGSKQYELNHEFGKQIAISKGVDEVILIGKEQTKPIYEGLLLEKYPEKQIHILNNVVDAYGLIYRLKGNEEVFALFENDLPDTFNEK